MANSDYLTYMELKMKVIEAIEKRFLEVAGFNCNLKKFPLTERDCPQTEKNKKKSDLHGEVFTPLWFVDKMILKTKNSLKKAKAPHDLCAGYGQFTIRMLRFLDDNKSGFKPNIWLSKRHSFSEYQVSSAYKLLYIFGTNINLFIGDANQLGKLRDVDKGILFYSEITKEWINITDKVKEIFGEPTEFSMRLEEKFVKKFDKLKNKIENDLPMMGHLQRGSSQWDRRNLI